MFQACCIELVMSSNGRNDRQTNERSQKDRSGSMEHGKKDKPTE